MLTEFDSFVASQLSKSERWSMHYDKQISVSSSLNEIIRMTETKKPILLKWVPMRPLCDDMHVQVRILFFISSLVPIEAHCVDLVEVRMRKFTEYGQMDENINLAVSDDFNHVEVLESGRDHIFNQKSRQNLIQVDLEGVKQKSMKIIQKAILALISKQRQPTMKVTHYPQSRLILNIILIYSKKFLEAFTMLSLS